MQARTYKNLKEWSFKNLSKSFKNLGGKKLKIFKNLEEWFFKTLAKLF